MNSIRGRFVISLFLGLAVMTALGQNIYQNYSELNLTNQNIYKSYQLINALSITTTHDDKVLLADVISASNSQRKNFLLKIQKQLSNKKKLSHSFKEALIKNEKQFRESSLKKIIFLKKKLTYDFVLLFSLLSLFPVLIWVYLKSNILKPLDSLAIQMKAFIEGKYNYHFSLPPSNEIGGLHQSFNTIAQTVLKQMDDLKTLDKAKSEFLSIASHELRTPLTSLKGSLGLLRSGVIETFSPKSLKLINIAESETDRLIRLINDILDLAKIEAQKLPLSMNWHPLSELIQTTTTSLGGLAQTAEVELKTYFTNDVEVYIDSDRIQQVLTNLISNAIKYSPKGSQVQVNTILDQNHLLYIEVIDSGKGIAPEDQELIFQKFRQATGPNNPLVKGTGLGLSIAKALVEEHGGQIGLSSKLNEGCRFYFTLPKWRQNNSIAFPKAA